MRFAGNLFSWILSPFARNTSLGGLAAMLTAAVVIFAASSFTSVRAEGLPTLQQSALTGQYPHGWQRTTPIALQHGPLLVKRQVGGA